MQFCFLDKCLTSSVEFNCSGFVNFSELLFLDGLKTFSLDS